MQRHDELPPLTADQQAEALRLAARLQAAHEAQAASASLLRAAAEAGIEERFVRDAIGQVLQERRRSVGFPPPVAATLLLAVANGWTFLAHPRDAVGVLVESWQIALLTILAFAGSWWASRERSTRWTMPLAVPAIWTALGIPLTMYLRGLHGYTPGWLLASIVITGAFQFVAACLGALLWSYDPRARTGRLSRKAQP